MAFVLWQIAFKKYTRAKFGFYKSSSHPDSLYQVRILFYYLLFCAFHINSFQLHLEFCRNLNMAIKLDYTLV